MSPVRPSLLSYGTALPFTKGLTVKSTPRQNSSPGTKQVLLGPMDSCCPASLWRLHPWWEVRERGQTTLWEASATLLCFWPGPDQSRFPSLHSMSPLLPQLFFFSAKFKVMERFKKRGIILTSELNDQYPQWHQREWGSVTSSMRGHMPWLLFPSQQVSLFLPTIVAMEKAYCVSSPQSCLLRRRKEGDKSWRGRNATGRALL